MALKLTEKESASITSSIKKKSKRRAESITRKKKNRTSRKRRFSRKGPSLPYLLE